MEVSLPLLPVDVWQRNGLATPVQHLVFEEAAGD